MNYHFCVDDKFINKFIVDAQKVSNGNVFVFVFQKNIAKHVKFDKGIEAPFGSKNLKRVIKEIKVEDKVFFHPYMQQFSNDIIKNIPKETKIYTIFWGAEFLQLPANCGYNNKIGEFLYEPKTLEYIKKTTPKPQIGITSTIKSMNFKKILHRIFYYRINEWKNNKIRSEFLKRITAICHWNQLDIDVLEELYKVSIKNIKFCNGVFTESGTILPKRKIKNEVLILLGNSDTPTNNHLEALELLKKFKDDEIKIYCPLNYHKQDYAFLIAKRGKEIFGDKFIPILDFIPRDEYFHMINNVDICFMNHKRTQAAGNISVLIRKGAKIFLNKKSTIYHLFKNLGLKVYTTEEIVDISFSELQKNQESHISLKNYQLHNDYMLNGRTEELEKLLK